MILDLERNGWRLIFTINTKITSYCVVFDGARRERRLGAAAWIPWLRNEYGIFEKVSYGGCVLRNASAMIAEGEALRKGIEHLTVFISLTFKLKIQVGQYSANLMRSLCVSSVFTMV